jgi:hypothetical protein
MKNLTLISIALLLVVEQMEIKVPLQEFWE